MNDLYQDSNGVIHAVKSDSMGKTIFAWTNCGRDITDFFRSNEKANCSRCLEINAEIK